MQDLEYINKDIKNKSNMENFLKNKSKLFFLKFYTFMYK